MKLYQLTALTAALTLGLLYGLAWLSARPLPATTSVADQQCASLRDTSTPWERELCETQSRK
jgi:hypothetical protein